jgi:hypothetical protein
MSQPQATLVVVRQHCTYRDNSDRIGRPKDENLKLRKEEREEPLALTYRRFVARLPTVRKLL